MTWPSLLALLFVPLAALGVLLRAPGIVLWPLVFVAVLAAWDALAGAWGRRRGGGGGDDHYGDQGA